MAAIKRVLGGQLSLFASTRRGERRRTILDDATWIEHVSGWLNDDHLLMALLAETASWEQRERWMYDRLVIEPRLTAEFPVLAHAPIIELRDLGARLSSEYGVPYDRAWLNLYRNHEDSTAWHADKNCRRDETIVPVLSLGETRRFLVRPKAGGRSTTFVVKGGDLLVMGGRCQRDWVHAVPKETTWAGPRISINFASATQADASTLLD